MRRIWPLTVRGTGAVVLAIGCLAAANEVGVEELLYFGVLLIAAVVAALISLYLARHSEQVVRTVRPEVAAVGDTARVSMQVTVRSSLPTAPGTWTDRLPQGLDGAARGEFPALRSGWRAGEQSVTFHYELTGTRRGTHSLGPLSVRTTDPFGLARRQSTLGRATTVSVAPALIDLPPLIEYPGDAGGALHAVTSQLGQGADNLIARHYVPGDSMRRIHWRASAHRDALMVRQEEQESTPEATVVLDLGVRRWAPAAMQAPGADPAFERAVSLCVSAVARLVTDGYAVEVIDSGGTPLTDQIDAGDTSEVDEFVVHCATLTARRDDRLAQLAPMFTGGSAGPVVLIVGRLDADDVTMLAPLAHHSALPVLLAVMPAPGALEQAESFGWHTGAVGGDDLNAVGEAWAAAVARGATHVW
ncbi:DUF58 domain-containing protein [Microbacterium terricola]|uniref:Membrane protein n=1 Tax=Microbacterium terricola TaxID=344163 RepID=A0ABM8E0R9_9MICO|nr:DUF58 domain-containing protein [Microbacterium terricola]UYK40858.1 DUF58 domain-containing protein [Microbacterium terricola]BDV31392.1 membrane protein [Microbacterium terricola]